MINIRKRKKVLVITDEFPPDKGGIAIILIIYLSFFHIIMRYLY